MNKNSRLIQLREQRGLTQEQLAQDVNLSQSMVSYIEAGEKEPSPVIMARLARYFNVTVDWLFFDQRYDQTS